MIRGDAGVLLAGLGLLVAVFVHGALGALMVVIGAVLILASI